MASPSEHKMSITITSTPSELEPVYSPFYIACTSTLADQPNFRFVFDTYVINLTGVTETKVNRSRLFPRPDGTGLYSPAGIMKNYVSFDFRNIHNIEFNYSMDSMSGYAVKLGQEYDLTATTYSFSSITNNGGFVQYNFAQSMTPYFAIGDVIKIDKANKRENVDYDGLQTISSFSGVGVVTSKVYGSTELNASGNCVYRLTMDTGATFSGACINFARQFDERTLDVPAKYYIGSGLGYPLTNHTIVQSGETNGKLLNKSISCTPNDSYILSWVAPELNFPEYMSIVTYDSAGAAIGLYTISNELSATTGYRRFDFGVGPRNLSMTNGKNFLNGGAFQNIYTSDVKYIYVAPAKLGETEWIYAKGVAIEVKEDCSNYDYYRLAFLNRLGGIDAFNFNRKSVRKLEIERETMTKFLSHDYSTTDRGLTQLNTSYEEEITANSNWITETQATIMEELFTSPEVYLVTTPASGNLLGILPVVVLSKDFTTKTTANDKLIQYTIKFKMAYKTKLQSN